MITFKEFVDIAEKYYEPDELLPSGKTPYGKATSSYFRQKGEVIRDPKRTRDQLNRVLKQKGTGRKAAARGADNPDFDDTEDKSGKYDIETDSDDGMTVDDKENNLMMRVRRKNQIAPGYKPVYDVEWYNNSEDKSKLNNPGKARSVVRSVADMWKNQVAPRLPNNSVLTNFPISNDTSERNTRSKLYSKVAGFGQTGMQGRQYAEVGRNPSPKESEKGDQRVRPLSGNLDPENVYSRSELDKLSSDRAHMSLRDRMLINRKRKKPIIIASAKPSRPEEG
jgi:hypothetical protein